MRSEEVSTESAASACSSALYIVGTPWKTVTRSRSMISSALSGSKRGSIVTHAPVRTAQFIVQVCPNVWNSGSDPSSTSSVLKSPRARTETVQLLCRLAWVSSAPFGVPVVPLV